MPKRKRSDESVELASNDSDDEREWPHWLEEMLKGRAGLYRELAEIVLGYACIVCQWCDKIEAGGSQPSSWWALESGHNDWLALARLCPDDFGNLWAAVCRMCGEKFEYESELLFCVLCERYVGRNCCAQIMWCQSNNCYCSDCTDDDRCLARCTGCQTEFPAKQFSCIQSGMQIVEDGTDEILCDTCLNK